MEERPFVFGTAATGDNFTDREKETKRISANFIYGVNTILISPRRWGKTSLIKRVREKVASKDLKVVFIDIFSCRSPEEFYSRFAECVIKQTSSRTEEWLENIKKFLLRFNPKLSMGMDPINDISLSMEFLPREEDAVEILSLPEKIASEKKCRIVVCIDEFQQIGEFKDSLTFQKQLRTVWQHQELTSYCLFGSKKHLMTELFEKISYPFYKFGDIFFLEKIPTDIWVKFICDRFKETGKKISEELAKEICELVENQSNYVQQLAWIVWVNSDEIAMEEDVKDSYKELINHNSMLFERMTENLTSFQLNFLRAIVNGIHNEFSTQTVLNKYQLGTSANISKIKEALLKQDLIDINNKEVSIPDPVFRAWLRKKLS